MATSEQIKRAARKPPKAPHRGSASLGDEALIEPLHGRFSEAERIERERALTYLCKMVAVGKLDPDVFQTIYQSLGVFMSNDGLYAILEGKYRKQLKDGEHFWAYFGVWAIDNPEALVGHEVHLDQENMVSLTGPQCALCGVMFEHHEVGTPCRGL